MTVAEITDRLSLARDVVDDLWECLRNDGLDSDGRMALLQYRLDEIRFQLRKAAEEWS